MSKMTDDDALVSNFGYFLRFIMRKKRLRSPQVAALLGWSTTFVEKVLYGSESPPAEGEVERLIVALNCDALEADGLRLFSMPHGSYVSLRRQLDERTAEGFEAKGALEEAEKKLAALGVEVARLEGAGEPKRDGDTRPISRDELDGERAEAHHLWKQLLPTERALVLWLVESGMIARVREVVEKAGWKPA